MGKLKKIITNTARYFVLAGALWAANALAHSNIHYAYDCSYLAHNYDNEWSQNPPAPTPYGCIEDCYCTDNTSTTHSELGPGGVCSVSVPVGGTNGTCYTMAGTQQACTCSYQNGYGYATGTNTVAASECGAGEIHGGYGTGTWGCFPGVACTAASPAGTPVFTMVSNTTSSPNTQTQKYSISGTFVSGDVININVGNQVVSYDAAVDTPNTMATKIANFINGQPIPSYQYSGYYSSDGTYNSCGYCCGGPHTYTASASGNTVTVTHHACQGIVVFGLQWRPPVCTTPTPTPPPPPTPTPTPGGCTATPCSTYTCPSGKSLYLFLNTQDFSAYSASSAGTGMVAANQGSTCAQPNPAHSGQQNLLYSFCGPSSPSGTSGMISCSDNSALTYYTLAVNNPGCGASLTNCVGGGGTPTPTTPPLPTPTATPACFDSGGVGRACNDSTDCCSGYTCEVVGNQPLRLYSGSPTDATGTIGVSWTNGSSSPTSDELIAGGVIGGSAAPVYSGPTRMCVNSTYSMSAYGNDPKRLEPAMGGLTADKVDKTLLSWDSDAGSFICNLRADDKYRLKSGGKPLGCACSAGSTAMYMTTTDFTHIAYNINLGSPTLDRLWADIWNAISRRPGLKTAVEKVSEKVSENISPPDAHALPPTGATFSFTPNTYAFGNVTVGSSSTTQTITIQNTSATKSATDCVITPSDSSNFVVTPQPSCYSLAAGASCTVTLAGHPASTGLFTTTLGINCDGLAKNENQFNVDRLFAQLKKQVHANADRAVDALFPDAGACTAPPATLPGDPACPGVLDCPADHATTGSVSSCCCTYTWSVCGYVDRNACVCTNYPNSSSCSGGGGGGGGTGSGTSGNYTVKGLSAPVPTPTSTPGSSCGGNDATKITGPGGVCNDAAACMGGCTLQHQSTYDQYCPSGYQCMGQGTSGIPSLGTGTCQPCGGGSTPAPSSPPLPTATPNGSPTPVPTIKPIYTDSGLSWSSTFKPFNQAAPEPYMTPIPDSNYTMGCAKDCTAPGSTRLPGGDPSTCTCTDTTKSFDTASWSCIDCPIGGHVTNGKCSCPYGWETVNGYCKPKMPSLEFIRSGTPGTVGGDYPVCAQGSGNQNKRIPVTYGLAPYTASGTDLPRTSDVTHLWGNVYPYSTPKPQGSDSYPWYAYADTAHCACSGAPLTGSPVSGSSIMSPSFSGDTLEYISSFSANGLPNKQYGMVAMALDGASDGRQGSTFTSCGCPNVNEYPVVMSGSGPKGVTCTPVIPDTEPNRVFAVFDPNSDDITGKSLVYTRTTVNLSGGISGGYTEPLNGASVVKTISIPTSQGAPNSLGSYPRHIWKCQIGYDMDFTTSPPSCKWTPAKHSCDTTSPMDPKTTFATTVNKKLACCMNNRMSTYQTSAEVKFDCIDSNVKNTGNFEDLWKSADDEADGGEINAIILAGSGGKPLSGFYTLDGARCNELSEFDSVGIQPGILNPGVANSSSQQTKVNGAAGEGQFQAVGARIMPATGSTGYNLLKAGFNTAGKAMVAPQPANGNTAENAKARRCPILVRAAIVTSCPAVSTAQNAVKYTHEDSPGVHTRCPAAETIQVHIRAEQVWEIAGTPKMITVDTVVDRKNASSISLDQIIRRKNQPKSTDTNQNPCMPGMTMGADGCHY